MVDRYSDLLSYLIIADEKANVYNQMTLLLLYKIL